MGSEEEGRVGAWLVVSHMFKAKRYLLGFITSIFNGNLCPVIFDFDLYVLFFVLEAEFIGPRHRN